MGISYDRPRSRYRPARSLFSVTEAEDAAEPHLLVERLRCASHRAELLGMLGVGRRVGGVVQATVAGKPIAAKPLGRHKPEGVA